MLGTNVPLIVGGPPVIQRGQGDYAVSISDSARILNLSKRTLWRLIASEKIKAIALSARRRGIRASELARYLNEASSET